MATYLVALVIASHLVVPNCSASRMQQTQVLAFSSKQKEIHANRTAKAESESQVGLSPPSLPSHWASVIDSASMRSLASGGFSDVFVATTLKDECGVATQVVIKKLSEEWLERSPEMWDREIYLPTLLSHPNLVRVYDFTPHSREPHAHARAHQHLVLLEYIGPVLDESVKAISQRKDPNEVARIALDLARGLQQIHHAGWVYRDLRPKNALVSESGTVKLTNFGVACKLGSCAEWRGSYSYMAPEMHWDNKEHRSTGSFSSDVWALGIVIAELWNGIPPIQNTGDIFKARLPDGIFSGMDDRLAHLANKMLAPIRKDRPKLDGIIDSLERIRGSMTSNNSKPRRRSGDADDAQAEEGLRKRKRQSGGGARTLVPCLEYLRDAAVSDLAKAKATAATCEFRTGHTCKLFDRCRSKNAYCVQGHCGCRGVGLCAYDGKCQAWQTVFDKMNFLGEEEAEALIRFRW